MSPAFPTTGPDQAGAPGVQHRIAIDSGRCVLPLPLQQPFPSIVLGHAFTATVSIDPAIAIYPMDEWEIIEYELMRLPSVHNHVRRLQRLLIGNAVKIQQSDDGTIYLPPHLTHYAEIRTNAVGVGFLNKIELWSPKQLRHCIIAPNTGELGELRQRIENARLNRSP